MRFSYLYILAFVSLMPLLALLPPGLPTTHDGADHLARIASFYNGLSDGILFPRWGENLNCGYGHPVLMFLYPFSSYLTSFFHFLGFSYIDSLKIVFGLGYVASGITMYVWAKEQFNKDVGFVAAVLYLFAPYRFIDLYVRGAIGEHMAFIFPPLVLFFIFKFVNSDNVTRAYYYLCGISLSFAILLLSHNAVSLMFSPLLLGYSFLICYQHRKFRKSFLVIVFFLVGLLLSSFFTFPAFFEGKFTLRDIVTGNEYKSRFVDNPLKFVYGEWNYGITGQFSVQLGVIHLLSLIILPYFLLSKKIKKSAKQIILLMSFFLAISLFLQLSASNFVYEILTILKKFQFPWRFLSLSTFCISAVAASMLLAFDKKRRVVGVIVILIVLLLTTFPFWQAKGYILKEDGFYDQIYYGTTDTGESSPIWSVRFMEKKPSSNIEVIYGEADMVEVGRKSNLHTYSIKVFSNEARFRENTLYFPGWKVFANGVETGIQFHDPQQRGLITFILPKGEHFVEVKFGDTKLRTLSNLITLLTVIILIVAFFIIRLRKT